jgi:hypothetical protein
MIEVPQVPAGPARSSGGILDRQPLMDWYRRSRARSEALFDLIDDEWNAAESRVEMHLVSTREQRVVIPRAQVDVTLKEGERIWTESSYKYEPMEVTRLLSRCGFAARSQWVDNDARFALTLADVE